MNLLFLGTSSSEALPRIDCDCPQCQSKDKKDRRTRSAILINNKILIDAGPDIIEQFSIYNFQISNLKAVIITHQHEDHIKGLKNLKTHFRPKGECCEGRISNLKIYYPKDGQRFKTEGVEFFAFEVPHSKIVKTHGLLINKKIAYIPDFSEITSKMKKIIKRSKIAILDGSMLNRPFGGHLPITKIISNLKSQISNLIVYFTHNGHTHLPHKELEKFIQKQGGRNFHLAYDGLEIRI
jgi:phosphoribosyl 1,2-cyclic phosphate phosphodiesterase